MLITGDNLNDVSNIIENLDDVFALKVLGKVHHFLRIEVTKIEDIVLIERTPN